MTPDLRTYTDSPVVTPVASPEQFPATWDLTAENLADSEATIYSVTVCLWMPTGSGPLRIPLARKIKPGARKHYLRPRSEKPTHFHFEWEGPQGLVKTEKSRVKYDENPGLALFSVEIQVSYTRGGDVEEIYLTHSFVKP